MTDKQLFGECINMSSSVVAYVHPRQLNSPTPDTEWNVGMLLHHMLYELCWVPDILTGATLRQVGLKYEGDLFGDDFQASWQRAAGAALTSIDDANLDATAHLSYGDVPTYDYIFQAATDQLIHAWDLGQGIGKSVDFNERLARLVYEAAIPDMRGNRPTGMFHPEIKVGDEADYQTKLLALYGRHSVSAV